MIQNLWGLNVTSVHDDMVLEIVVATVIIALSTVYWSCTVLCEKVILR